MREINAAEISGAIKELCISSNKLLPADLCERIEKASQEEEGLAKSVMCDLCSNLAAAKELDIPICQDTGMTVVFAEVGREVHISGGEFEDAINDGVRRGYTEGLLRCSVVSDPLLRINTGDNTPAVIHTRIVPGDKIKLTVAPKGFGSENMSALKMLTPAASKEDIIEYAVDCVKKAGSNPCPPMVIGVGIGGDFEYCAYLAKKLSAAV